MEKKDLKPAGVFKYFEEICQVPRPSKKEEKMIAYLKAFGAKHNLETKVDEAGNVLIKKPATPGLGVHSLKIAKHRRSHVFLLMSWKKP
jgi:dipeptidase D